MISVIILTKNEERDLPGCLHSVRWCDDVHIFDSGSTDNTLAVARSLGAQVHEREFDSYAAQRNAALDTVVFKHQWVFLLDADERLNLRSWNEAVEAVATARPAVNAFRIRRQDHFLGRRLRYAQIMAQYTRLVRIGFVRYTRAVNEYLEVEGETGQLRGYFDHHSFSKGLERWFEKHNRYSTMEARIVAERSFEQDAKLTTALFAHDFHTRRRAQKAIFYKLPARPVLRWAYLLFARGGVLDGRAGLIYATLQAVYEWQIVLKTREMVDVKRTQGPELALRSDLPGSLDERGTLQAREA